MKTLLAILILILLTLEGCGTIARRDVVYEPDTTNASDRNIFMGRVIVSQLAIMIVPFPFLPQWQKTDLSYRYIVVKFKSPNSPKCPSLEINGRFYSTRPVLSDTASEMLCASNYLPMEKDTESISVLFQDTTYHVQYKRKVLWFWGLCRYEGLCEDDFGYEPVWGKSL